MHAQRWCWPQELLVCACAAQEQGRERCDRNGLADGQGELAYIEVVFALLKDEQIEPCLLLGCGQLQAHSTTEEQPETRSATSQPPILSHHVTEFTAQRLGQHGGNFDVLVGSKVFGILTSECMPAVGSSQIGNLAAALAGRRKYVDEVSDSVTGTGTGTGLSDSIRTSGKFGARTRM
jgi:hypothetical protein